MTTFLRLLSDKDKATHLLVSATAHRTGKSDAKVYRLEPESFRAVPGAPFAYWVSQAVRDVFVNVDSFQRDWRTAQHGGSTKDDFRFLRLFWECEQSSDRWTLFAKGGSFSPFYADIYLAVNWTQDAYELEAALLDFDGLTP